MLRTDEAIGLTGNSRYEGFIKDLLQELAADLKFKYRILLPPDGKYGAFDNATGRWSGMVGMLQNGVSRQQWAGHQCVGRT